VRSGRIGEEEIWGKAVHRVAADGISPEQAIDEAVARIKEMPERVADVALGPDRR
jgi:hypothetical protein